MREIERARCSCTGEVEPEGVERDYNCGRGCCGAALRCTRCGVRFAIEFEPPEWTP